ncbi:MAG: beta-ketoacyl synthase N-terminal-like domain-containing protein, partial [Stackebrandtia sp.]
MADRLDAPAPGPASPDVDEELLPGLCLAVGEIVGVSPQDIQPDDELDTLGLDTVGKAELADRIARDHHVDFLGQPAISDCRSVRDVANLVASMRCGGGGDNGTSRDDTLVLDFAYRLCDVAFTLQAGREELQERLAVVVSHLDALVSKLRLFSAGESQLDVLRGSVSGETQLLSTVLDGKEGEAFLDGLHRTGNLAKIARLWVSGVDVAFPARSRARSARRVSLPTYPFARDRYWLPASPARVAPVPALELPPVPAAEPLPVPAEVVTTPPAAQGPSEASWDEVRATIAEAMASVLEVPVNEFILDLPHVDFGVDSVLAVEIVDRINRTLDVTLKPTDFFSYATLRKLTDHVEQMRPTPRIEPDQPPNGVVVSGAVPEAPARPRIAATGVAAAGVAAAGVASTDVAVIGMSARFPDAPDLDQLWANLAAGRDSVAEIPPHRWDVCQHWDPDPLAAGKTYSKWGSVLEDVGMFDPAFFGMSPREARLMDPQQRLYLMEAWRALEDAGYSDRALDGTECHSFVGTAMGDYHHLLRDGGVPLEGYTFTGTHPAVLASRISYHLNLRGPSVAVDTSCSSSLMAVHLACEAIRAGRTELALAGGVAALFTPELHILASKAGMLSPGGRCRAFDDAADGFVPGEGVGVVVLKNLAQALRDGDHIHGVIAGSGSNQDGKTNGITAPSAPSQT